MTTAYTSLLGLALPVTGELSGTWGDVVNNYITSYVDAAVAGAQTISGSQTAVTLSTTNGLSLAQAGAGATGSAQYAIINCTGNPASLLTITAPATSKAYLVLNATSTNQSVKVVGAGPTTGVTVATGQAALIAWNGSDFRLIATTDIAQLSGTLTVAKGGTGQTTYTDGQLLIGNSTGNTLTKSTLTAGSGVTITNGSGSITIAATGSGGTVTSVGGTGSVNGITLSGTVTSSGNLTLGGSLSGVSLTSQVTGTLPAANGGTGNVNGTVAKVATTNFTVEESGGKLVIKYGATTLLSIDSSGNMIVKANITAAGTP